mgnify:CR=1 FL=1
MQICDNQHPPIVHEEHTCPICDLLSQLETTESLLSDLEERRDNLLDQYETFKSHVYPHLPELLI